MLFTLALSTHLLSWGTAKADVALYEETCPTSRRASPLAPLPSGSPLDAAKVELGRRLFHDPRLSGDGTIACSSCHDLASGGDDGRARSVGIGGATGDVNAPTVLNRAFDFRLFWDGRARDLRDQLEGPLHHPKEMGSSWAAAISVLGSDAPFVRDFERAYPSGLDTENLADAIVTFERSLVTPGAPFDRFLCGEDAALSNEAVRGYELFLEYGCVSCHQGRNVGGNMFQRFGVLGDYFADRGGITAADLGRYNQTGAEGDRHVFKVPSLRNVELTAPYFHDGSAETLEDAVRTMAKYQLGLSLPSDDVTSLVAFLRSLTGSVQR